LLAPEADQPGNPAEMLPTVLTDPTNEIRIPNGIGGVGFDKGDIDDLVPGTMKQRDCWPLPPR